MKPKYNAQNPMDHGQRRAPTQERINQALSDWGAMKKGARNWAPDVAGFFLGDIPDALAYVARRAKNVQGEQSVPSLGAGNAVRRAVHDLQAQFGLEDKFVPPTGQVVGPVYEPSPLEEVSRFVNPLQFVNPANVARGAGLGSAEVVARAMQSEGPLAQMLTAGIRPMGIIKQKGGNFLPSKFGTFEDALSKLKKWDVNLDPIPLPAGSDLAETEALSARGRPMNNWIDKALTKYVKNQMATPEDPIRALAEQGIVHKDLPGDASTVNNAATIMDREKMGFPRLVTGVSQAAKNWEAASDRAFNPQFVGSMPVVAGEPEWVAALRQKSPSTPIYRPQGSIANNLGFDHLIDELSNSINPESGLPRHLLFPADRLDKVSVPQAVQRVSDINKWRAEQKVLADQARANNAATVLHKEYPEKGMKWVQLKAGEKKLPEGYSMEYGPGNGGTYITNPSGEVVARGRNADEALTKLTQGPLADALKYEGDTMGHCVGGYCDDVASGRSNIFSLRDSKGQPHVTIETGPADVLPTDAHYDRAMEEVMLKHPTWDIGGSKAGDLIDSLAQQYAVAETPSVPRIVQIKGKGNAKPHDDYLPYVQDFVKSGQWSDVGDLQNAGLYKGSDSLYNYMPTSFEAPMPNRWDALSRAREAGAIDPNAYYSREEWEPILQRYLPDQQNFAQGGSVSAPKEVKTLSDLRAIIASLS